MRFAGSLVRCLCPTLNPSSVESCRIELLLSSLRGCTTLRCTRTIQTRSGSRFWGLRPIILGAFLASEASCFRATDVGFATGLAPTSRARSTSPLALASRRSRSSSSLSSTLASATATGRSPTASARSLTSTSLPSPSSTLADSLQQGRHPPPLRQLWHPSWWRRTHRQRRADRPLGRVRLHRISQPQRAPQVGDCLGA
mgnify:FL=1